MTARVLPFTPRPDHLRRPTLGLFCEIIQFPERKAVFATVLEALLALSLDKLGTVHRRADRVFVMTNRGAGEFPAETWDAHT